MNASITEAPELIIRRQGETERVICHTCTWRGHFRRIWSGLAAADAQAHECDPRDVADAESYR